MADHGRQNCLRQLLWSVQGRFRSRHGVQQLAPGTRAGQHYLVDLTFTDLRQLADVAAGLRDVVSRHGLCRITSELVETVEYRAQLGECVQGGMCLLRRVRGFALFRIDSRRSRPTPLWADERYIGGAFPRPRDVESEGAIKWTWLSRRSFAATASPSAPCPSPTTSAISCERWQCQSGGAVVADQPAGKADRDQGKDDQPLRDSQSKR